MFPAIADYPTEPENKGRQSKQKNEISHFAALRWVAAGQSLGPTFPARPAIPL